MVGSSGRSQQWVDQLVQQWRQQWAAKAGLVHWLLHIGLVHWLLHIGLVYLVPTDSAQHVAAAQQTHQAG